MLKLKSVNFDQQDFQIHALDAEYPDQTEWLIGRKPTCDIVLPCPEVSRVHGRIAYHDDAYHFIDVGSTGGSLLNGERIDAALEHPLGTPLGVGDLLQLGKTFLYVEAISPPTFLRETGLSPDTWTTGELLCRCCRIVDETPDVKTFYLKPESPMVFDYLPGQFVTLAVEIQGQRVLRPYSISTSPTRPYHLSITVKRVPTPATQPDAPAGVVSNWLHDHLQVGDRLTLLGGPLGTFSCVPNVPNKLLLLSAGSGISPMMSMARWLQDTLSDCDIIFFHSARTVEDVVFRAELEQMATQMPNFHLYVTVTQMGLQRSWMGLTGRISDTMVHLVAPDLADRTVYVCGPDGFMQATRSLMQSLQFPMERYHEESFGGAAPNPTSKPGPRSAPESVPESAPAPESVMKPGPAAATEPVAQGASSSALAIAFTQSNQTLSTDGTDSLLELAEQAGVAIPSACRAGACGACKVRTHRGRVRYANPPLALTAADQQAGCVLACVAYPAEDLEIAA
jgi:glycine betaine catabolism B